MIILPQPVLYVPAAAGGRTSVFSDDFSGHATSTQLQSLSDYDRVATYYEFVVQADDSVETNGPNDNERTSVTAQHNLGTNHYVEITAQWTDLTANKDLELLLAYDDTDHLSVKFLPGGGITVEVSDGTDVDSTLTWTSNINNDQTFAAELNGTTGAVQVFVDGSSVGTVTNANYAIGGDEAGFGVFMAGGTAADDIIIKDVEVGNWS